MNINLEDIVKISVKEGAGIEKINIRYIRSNIPSSNIHSDQHNKNKNHSKSKTSSNDDMSSSSKSDGCKSPVEYQTSPSRKSSTRPKESYYFGQNPLPQHETYEEEKDSALYKVRKNEVLTHPELFDEKPINVSVQKCYDSQGQHFSAVTFSDDHLDERQENDMGIIIL